MTTEIDTRRLIAGQPVSALSHNRTSALPGYVLITPARNEASFIELTIGSVLAQSERPIRWVIVSDGSTDGTDGIVQRYTFTHPWIELVRLTERAERNFAGKVLAINAGLSCVSGLPYEVVACLDADITFDPGYFSFLLEKIASCPALGVVGTPYKETTSEMYDYRYVGAEHVSGACQVFRRACFEAIGGYTPVRGGAIDTIATTTARMMGWKTHSFTERACFHHRVVGTAEHGRLSARFVLGQRDYAIGNHPLWEFFRCVYQATKRPFVMRGLAVGAGYAWALLRHESRPVSRELVQFRRNEQMHRLAKKLSSFFSFADSRTSSESARNGARLNKERDSGAS